MHLYFSGYVQAVGFRATTEYCARQLGVTGWVRNLRDGRVEVVAEGDEVTLRALLDRLRHRFGRYVRSVEEEWSEGTGEFARFEITF